MELKDLGYTDKWIRYGLLNKEILNDQFLEFQKGEDQNTEHYRYGTFLNWLRGKENLTNQEIENFIELALEDEDELMAGSAVKELFTSPQITANQFDLVKQRLPKIGAWTTKLISREVLKKKIKNENLTNDLFRKCIIHTKEFDENVLVELIIKETENSDFITQFTTDDYGKKIRNLAKEKLKRIKKAGNTM
jgi:hypothetical protein